MALQMFFRYFVDDVDSGPEVEQFVDQVLLVTSLYVCSEQFGDQLSLLFTTTSFSAACAHDMTYNLAS